jgi:hypothetical protein
MQKESTLTGIPPSVTLADGKKARPSAPQPVASVTTRRAPASPWAARSRRATSAFAFSSGTAAAFNPFEHSLLSASASRRSDGHRSDCGAVTRPEFNALSNCARAITHARCADSAQRFAHPFSAPSHASRSLGRSPLALRQRVALELQSSSQVAETWHPM